MIRCLNSMDEKRRFCRLTDGWIKVNVRNDLVQQPCTGIGSKIERNRSLSKRCLCSGTILLHSLTACGGLRLCVYSSWASPATAPVEGTRKKGSKLLEAIKDSGNSQMIESLNAAPEGRSLLELPALESGPRLS